MVVVMHPKGQGGMVQDKQVIRWLVFGQIIVPMRKEPLSAKKEVMALMVVMV